jgi:hypothetical protein
MSSHPPVHFLGRREGARCGVIACGVSVYKPSQYTTDPDKASCYACARNADGLTAAQRDTIWENTNERMDKFKRSPWADQLAAENKATA